MMSRHCFTGTRWYLNFETVFTLQIWVESLKVSFHYFDYFLNIKCKQTVLKGFVSEVIKTSVKESLKIKTKAADYSSKNVKLKFLQNIFFWIYFIIYRIKYMFCLKQTKCQIRTFNHGVLTRTWRELCSYPKPLWW